MQIGDRQPVSQEASIVSVLGLLWNTQEDTLSLDMRKILTNNNVSVTKRSIFAFTHQVFDPIGLLAPSLILPKILLQGLCKKKQKWDEAVPDEIRSKFLA